MSIKLDLNTDKQDLITYTFIWRSTPPSCRQCTALNGRVMRGQTLNQPVLYDSATGEPIWDLINDLPLTHGGTGINCDCHLEVVAEVDLSKAVWWQRLLEVKERLK